ncbi:MAG: PKD domain-containing protein [Chitinophagales bacterium]
MNHKLLWFYKSLLLIGILIAGSEEAAAQKTLRVLFIGNSYTYVNDLPKTIADIAQSRGDSLFYDSNTPGGTTFQMHCSNATTLQKIALGNWDYVVLQAQSQEPSFPPAQVASQTYPYAAILDSLIHAADSCTETVFYMTWGRKNGDASNCAGYPPICTYSGMQDRLRDSYLDMAQLNHASVVPAGEAWRRVIGEPHSFDLYQSDESHPTIFGTYLTAAAFYEVLFQKDVRGAQFLPVGISNAILDSLQKAAHVTVQDSLAKWLQYGDIPVARFTATQPDAVHFTNLSMNTTQVKWYFGDGDSSSAQNPVHPYHNSGNYTVRLVAANGCRSDAATAVVSVTVTGIHEGAPELIWLQTEEGAVLLNKSTEQLGLVLTDATGSVLRAWKTNENQIQINGSALPAGIYFLLAEKDGLTYKQKLAVIR